MANIVKRVLHAGTNGRYTLVRTMNLLGRARQTDVLSDEYVRVSTLELIADEIQRRGVNGSAAELGVYQGSFAKHINRLLPDRELLLFDTFSGFHSEHLAEEISTRLAAVGDDFSDTSVELVMSRMAFPDKVSIHRGLFPGSTEKLKDRIFCLVSIDCDLYEPILAGLRYFYARLSVGGFILVHDYNNILYAGAKKAVDAFCEENGVFPVPITDSAGTAVFCKPAPTHV